MHYYQFNIADYRKDTVHLTRIEHSIYRDLIDWYYLDEKPIPKETQSVIRRLRLVSETEVEGLKNVLNDFFMLEDDGYRHKRIDLEIIAYAKKAEINKANGQKGGRPKANNKENNPVGYQSVSELKPNAKATNNHEPITNNQLEENTYVQEDVKNSANKIANCEYQKVIDVYHECLPELSKARLLTKARERLIKQRWNWILTSKKPDGERRATNAQEALFWFENYFNRVRDNDFLMGRVKQSNDHKNWKCDIDFLMDDRGLKHVIEKTEG